jgi:translation initiation factor 1 (eIF-1/SUI1)
MWARRITTQRQIRDTPFVHINRCTKARCGVRVTVIDGMAQSTTQLSDFAMSVGDKKIKMLTHWLIPASRDIVGSIG